MKRIYISRRTLRQTFAGVVIVALSQAPFAANQARGQTKGNGHGDIAKPIRVEASPPERRTTIRRLDIPATLRAYEQATLFAKVSGYVADVPVDIGSRVKQGEVLLRISVPEMEDELRQAQAELQAQEAKVRAIRAKAIQAARMVEIAKAEVSRENARHDLDAINLERKQELHAGNAIPKQALDEALSAHEVTEAQLQIAKAQVAGAEAEKQAVDADAEVAQAQVAVAQANLGRLKTLMEYSSIKAPFDGVITMRNVDRGAFVRSAAEGTTTPLLRISLTDRIRLTLEVPEVDAMLVHIGTKVQIDVRASGEDPFPGVVSRIAGAFKPDTRTMQVEVDIDNHNGRLAPGMYARVVVMLESKAQAMVVPSKAIRVRGKETIVLVAVDGIAKAKTVEVGYDDGIWAEILSGLDAEEKVISATRGTVAPGVAVKLVTVGSS